MANYPAMPYLRYCDDFIILSNDENHLKSLIVSIREFLARNLQLQLHPKKLIIRKLSQGIDFVGYILFLRYTLVRTRTKRRMKKRLRVAYETYLKGKIDGVNLDQRLQRGFAPQTPQQGATRPLHPAVKAYLWVQVCGQGGGPPP